MNEQHLAKAKEVIDHAFIDPIGKALFNSDRETNVINRIGKNLGYEQLSSEDPELYEAISSYIKEKKNPTMNINESKKALNETSFEIPSTKNILRYDEDIVVKTIKDIIKKEFSNVTVEQIKGDEGGAFYSMIISLGLEENIQNDLERKRFYIMQAMQTFKAQFFGSISQILPIINMRTESYEFTKNSSKLRFGATICLSHTNDRDWVSGVYKGIDQKKKDAYEKQLAKDAITETAGSRKHAITALPLNKIIQRFTAGKIDNKMLETGIKACGRSELEFYVLRSVGVDVSVDISDVNANSTAKEDTNKAPKVEKAYDPNQDITEAEHGFPLMHEGVAGKRLARGTFDFIETPKRDIFDLIDQLKKMGCKAAAETINKIIITWPVSKYTEEQIRAIVDGRKI